MTTLGKILRIVAILLVGLTATVSLLSGAGSTCVALAAEKYQSMVAIVPYKWLYVFYVLSTIAASVYALYATLGLVRNREHAYRDALLSMALIMALGLAQVVTSRLLRGKSMPNDLRVYMSIFTLLVLLLLRIPIIWNRLGLGKPGGGSGRLAAGANLFLAGVIVLTIQFWAGPTHTLNGANFADAWHTPLAILGWALMAGCGLAFASWLAQPAVRVLTSASESA